MRRAAIALLAAAWILALALGALVILAQPDGGAVHQDQTAMSADDIPKEEA